MDYLLQPVTFVIRLFLYLIIYTCVVGRDRNSDRKTIELAYLAEITATKQCELYIWIQCMLFTYSIYRKQDFR